MEAHIDVITLAVSDLDRSLRFYRDGLGLPTDGIVGEEYEGDETHPAGAVAMFSLANGLILSLYPVAELAKDAGRPTAAVAGHGFSIGHAVDSSDAVDDLLERARVAGATVLEGGRKRPWGIYSGYFADPDGHLWEAVHFLPRPA